MNAPRWFGHRLHDLKAAWGFWRWQDIIPTGTDEVYLRRLHLIMTPFFGVKLHWIFLPDAGRDLHDHPWSFFSLVLRGGYTELMRLTPTLSRQSRVRWWNFKRASAAHRIESVRPGTITLVINGPKLREWGFYTPTGWMHWREYCNAES